MTRNRCVKYFTRRRQGLFKVNYPDAVPAEDGVATAEASPVSGAIGFHVGDDRIEEAS